MYDGDYWRDQAQRYRLAWLSAKQGRTRWQENYCRAMGRQLWALPVSWDNCTCGRIAVGTQLTDARNWNPSCPGHGVKTEWYNSEDRVEVRNLRRENSLLSQRLATVTRHDHAHRGQIQELEKEVADLRLALSEMQGAQSRERVNGEFPGVVACYNNRHCVSWGFCEHCAPELYRKAMERYRASGGASAENPSQLYADIVQKMAEGLTPPSV